MKKISTYYLVLLFFSASCFLQNLSAQEINIRSKIKYFLVEQAEDPDSTILNFNATDLLIDYFPTAHGSSDTICLNNIPIAKWPSKARRNPACIGKIKTDFKSSPYALNCGEAILSIHDLNNRIIHKESDNVFGLNTKNKDRSCNKKIKKAYKNLLIKILFPKKPFISRNRKHLGFSQEFKRTQSFMTEDSIKMIFKSREIESIEGIYEPLDMDGAIYTLAIVKADTSYNIICLESNLGNWLEGDMKGHFASFKINEPFTSTWFMLNNQKAYPKIKLTSENILDIEFNEPRFKKIKSYLKTYPKR